MTKENYLSGKKILIVDDEPDILATLEEILSECKTLKAANYEEAKNLLETQSFDMAILDIMGVNGLDLLDIAVQRNVLAVMLTANALSPEKTIQSYKQGAALYVPKEKITDIRTYLEDVLEAQQKGKNFWWRWFDRFSDYYDRQFGPHWQDPEKDIWARIQDHKEKATRYLYYPND